MAHSPDHILLQVPNVDLFQALQNQAPVWLRRDVMTVFVEEAAGPESLTCQVAEYKWRLHQQFPCLQSGPSTFVFCVEGRPDLFYLVTLPPGVTPDVMEILLTILRERTQFSVSAVLGVPVNPAEQPSTTNKVADSIVKTSSVIARDLAKAGEITARGIEWMANYAISKTKPVEPGAAPAQPPPTQPSPTNANWQRASSGIATGAAAVTRNVATGVGTMLTSAANYISKSVAESQTYKNVQEKHPDKVEAARTLGSATMAGLSEIWQGMEKAGRTVWQSGSQSVARYQEHRSGVAPVGQPSTQPAAAAAGGSQQGYVPPPYAGPPTGTVTGTPAMYPAVPGGAPGAYGLPPAAPVAHH